MPNTVEARLKSKSGSMDVGGAATTTLLHRSYEGCMMLYDGCMMLYETCMLCMICM